jgi:serine/threonine protein kinase
MIDYAIVNFNEKKYYFGIFNKINYSSSYIPLFFDLKQAKCLMFKSLKFIHKKKILHQDLKPNNIMCTPSSIVLIDFEFATFLRKKPLCSDIVKRYMHPKRSIDKNYISKKIDYWGAITSLFDIYFGNEDLFDKNDQKIIRKYGFDYFLKNKINIQSNKIWFYKNLQKYY